MSIKTYRDLEVWQKSMDLLVEIYKVAKHFPRDEQFGLINQIRRSVVSIPANIAEGYGRLHRGDYLRSLSIARGSLTETETHLLVAVRLEYITRDQAKHTWGLSQEVGRLLSGLIRSLERTSKTKNNISETSELYASDTDPWSPTPDPWE
jgi:four helix bundle protein